MTEHDSNSEFDRHAYGTGWFVGIIVALALLAIGYLVFTANSESCEQFVCSTTVEVTP